MKRRCRGFTLVEILLAVTIAAVLMAAVLAVLSGVGRDQKRLATQDKTNRPAAAIELLRWDLTNADTITQAADGIVLEGHGGIDASSLKPNNRLTGYRLAATPSSRKGGSGLIS